MCGAVFVAETISVMSSFLPPARFDKKPSNGVDKAEPLTSRQGSTLANYFCADHHFRDETTHDVTTAAPCFTTLCEGDN